MSSKIVNEFKFNERNLTVLFFRKLRSHIQLQKCLLTSTTKKKGGGGRENTYFTLATARLHFSLAEQPSSTALREKGVKYNSSFFFSSRKRSSSWPRPKNHNMGAVTKGKLSCKP